LTEHPTLPLTTPLPAPRPAVNFDCAQGCSLAGVSGVCGANGVTFINDCLAECAGTSVAHQGPCPAPGKQPAAAVVASVAAAGLASHPVGAFFATAGAPGAVSAAAGRADLRVASASDMQRFAAEGFLLAGPARLGEFEVTKPASSPSGG
jgi:hypothetical protein